MDQFKFNIVSQMDKSRLSDIFKPLDRLNVGALGSGAEPPPLGGLASAGPPATSGTGDAGVLALAVGATDVPQPDGTGTGERAVPNTPLKKNRPYSRARTS